MNRESINMYQTTSDHTRRMMASTTAPMPPKVARLGVLVRLGASLEESTLPCAPLRRLLVFVSTVTLWPLTCVKLLSRGCRQCYHTILALHRNVAQHQSLALPFCNSSMLLVQSLEDGPARRIHRLIYGPHTLVRHDIDDGI